MRVRVRVRVTHWCVAFQTLCLFLTALVLLFRSTMEDGPSPLSAADQRSRDNLRAVAEADERDKAQTIQYFIGSQEEAVARGIPETEMFTTDYRQIKFDEPPYKVQRSHQHQRSHQAEHGMARDEARAEAQAEARAEAQAAQAEHGFVFEKMAMNYEQQKEQDSIWRTLNKESKMSTAKNHFGRDDSKNAEKNREQKKRRTTRCPTGRESRRVISRSRRSPATLCPSGRR